MLNAVVFLATYFAIGGLVAVGKVLLYIRDRTTAKDLVHMDEIICTTNFMVVMLWPLVLFGYLILAVVGLLVIISDWVNLKTMKILEPTIARINRKTMEKADE